MSELTLAGPAGTPPALRTIPGPAGGALQKVRAFAAQPAVAKSMPALIVAGIVALAALAYMTLVQPPQRSLFQGLADSDKAAVADALGSAGIKYQIDQGSGSLTVSDGDYYRAKMLMAQQNLPKSAPDGDAMISALPMGASRAVEGERLRGARENDLARTIEQIDAVAQAKVHLAVEQPSVFLRDRSPAAASVMLRLRAGRALGDGQVQAIVNLVASSVPGLSPDQVSIVDQAGRLLSRPGKTDAASAASAQVELQGQIEQRYLEQLTKLLTPLVGADGFTAEVHADLEFAEVQATREIYPNRPGVIAQEQGGWQNEAAAKAEAGGIPGALSNTPPPPAQASATPPPAAAPGAPVPPAGTLVQGEAGKTSENYNRQFQLDHEVSVTRNPVGTVRRLSVAVALRQSAKPRGVAETQALENLIKGAVGFDDRRGDTIAVTSRAFAAAVPEEGAKWYEASWVGMAARNGSALLVALILVLGVARPMLKRNAAARAAAVEAAAAQSSAAALASPAIKQALGSEIAAAIAQEVEADPTRQVTLEMIESTPGYSDRATLIRNFVRQDPERAALVVRDLIRSDLPMPEKA